MRSLISRFVMCFLAITLLCVMPCMVFASGTVAGPVAKKVQVDGRVQRVELAYTFTADGEAAMAEATLNPATYGITGWYLYEVKCDPGSTGPSNGAWDVDITDSSGYLQSQNHLDDLSSSATSVYRFASSTYPMLWDAWTISIGDNAVNSATATIYLIFTSN